MMAPVAIPPPTIEPIAAMPDEIAAPPTVPDAPAKEANAAPVEPAVADIIVAADPPTTALPVEIAVAAVAPVLNTATLVEVFIESVIMFSLKPIACCIINSSVTAVPPKTQHHKFVYLAALLSRTHHVDIKKN